ncbi:MAG: Gldg family protein [Polyangiales bacterium]
MASTEQTKSTRESVVFTALLVLVLVAANVALSYIPMRRLDLTRNRLFSLADSSASVVKNLDDTLTITAYFTKDLPAPFNATERQVRDLLEEYAAVSNGNVRINFVNPDDEESESDARNNGVLKVQHQNIESDQVSVIEGYRGIVLNYLGEKKTLPVIENTDGLEYAITTSIKSLTGDKKKIGIFTGHESPTIEQGLTNFSGYLANYELVPVDGNAPIDNNIASVLLVGPQTALSDNELRYLDQYVMNGGALGVFGGSMKIDLTVPSATPVDTQINRLLKPWGVEVDESMVADWQCDRVPMRGNGGFQVLVPYPLFPVLHLTEAQMEHPVMYRLGTPLAPFSSVLKVGGTKTNGHVTILAQSSQNSWAMTGTPISLEPRDPREWPTTGETGPFPVAAAISGELPSAFSAIGTDAESNAIVAPTKSTRPVRVFVFGSSRFITDDLGLIPPVQPNEAIQLNSSLSLALNAIDWLTADGDLMAIRAKSIEDPALAIPENVVDAENSARASAQEGDDAGVKAALKEREAAVSSWDRKKSLYRWLNTLGIPLLFALYGIIRMRRRASMARTLKM